jgi:hypothetical protein
MMAGWLCAIVLQQRDRRLSARSIQKGVFARALFARQRNLFANDLLANVNGGWIDQMLEAGEPTIVNASRTLYHFCDAAIDSTNVVQTNLQCTHCGWGFKCTS